MREAERLNLPDVLWLVFVRVSTLQFLSESFCTSLQAGISPEGKCGWSYEEVRGQK